MQAYIPFAVKYPKLSSAIHTFISTFLVTLIGAISVIPADNLLNAQTWTMAFIVGVLTSALRAGVKAVSPLG